MIFCVFVFGLVIGILDALGAYRAGDLPLGVDNGPRLAGRVTVVALVAGPLWYFVLGTWYGLRLSFCMPDVMKWKLARRTFIFSELVYTLPLLVGLMASLAVQSGGLFLAALCATLLAMLWSVYVSYTGVRTLFHPSRGIAILLFAILPALFSVVASFAPLAIINWRADALESRVVAFENDWAAFSHTGNWWQRHVEDYPQLVSFDVGSAGFFGADIGRTDANASEILEGRAEVLARKFGSDPTDLCPITNWGHYQGVGKTFRFLADGDPTVGLVFLFETPDGRRVFITELVPLSKQPRLRPQFQMVEESFRVKP